MRRKYTQLVPQHGMIAHVPLECHLEMLSVTLTQWCGEERLDTPSARGDKQDNPVFALDDICPDLTDLSIDNSPSSDLIFGPQRVPADTVDNAIAHMIYYVNRGGASRTYPKCEACGLTGHKSDQCHPLVNYYVAQAMIAQHQDLVRRITAAYKKFPRHARSRTPRKATVKQLVAVLDLPTFGETLPDPVIAALTPADSTDFVTRLDTQDPAVFHCRVGTALVTYRDQPWYSPADEIPVQSFAPVDIPLTTCLLFPDDPGAHTVSHLNSGRDMLIDSGSTITMNGTHDGLMEYVSPSPSGIRIRSATGQIGRPTGEGTLSFLINDDKASLAAVCQHTPAITSSIFCRPKLVTRSIMTPMP
jgi:hypothetical protein